MCIYFHYFILANECIASKDFYFGGIDQNYRFTWLLFFSRLHAWSPQPYIGIFTHTTVLGKIRSLSWQTKGCQVLASPSKTSRIYRKNILLSRRTSHSTPTSNTQRMPFTEEKRCNYNLRHNSCPIHKTKMNKRTCWVSLQAPLYNFSPH